MNNDTIKYIAHLFYAIAKADKSLSLEEYIILTEMLDKNWNHLGDNVAVNIRSNFNMLQRHNAAPDMCFDEFVAYMNSHPDLFTQELQTLLLETTNAIAYAFAKINKSELTYMAKLSLAFKKLTS